MRPRFPLMPQPSVVPVMTPSAALLSHCFSWDQYCTSNSTCPKLQRKFVARGTDTSLASHRICERRVNETICKRKRNVPLTSKCAVTTHTTSCRGRRVFHQHVTNRHARGPSTAVILCCHVGTDVRRQTNVIRAQGRCP
jgi:hypothetical protein